MKEKLVKPLLARVAHAFGTTVGVVVLVAVLLCAFALLAWSLGLLTSAMRGIA